MKSYRLRFLVPMLLVLAASSLMLSCADKEKEEQDRLAKIAEENRITDSIAAVESADSIAASEAIAEEMAAEQEPANSLMPPRPTGEGFTVQVAGCESMEYAEYLVGVYAERGYEAYIGTITKDDQIYYRVRIGNYETMGPAKDLVLELVDKFSIDPWIDKIEQ